MPSVVVIIMILLLIVALYSSTVRPSVLFLIALTILLGCGILNLQNILNGLLTKKNLIIFLFVILSVALKKQVGYKLFNRLFKHGALPKPFLLRLILFVSSCSAFINNTPIAAFMIPYIKNRVGLKRLPASRFTTPLYFAVIGGGMITPGNYSFRDFFTIGCAFTRLYAAACIIYISWYYNL